MIDISNSKGRGGERRGGERRGEERRGEGREERGERREERGYMYKGIHVAFLTRLATPSKLQFYSSLFTGPYLRGLEHVS